MKIAPKYLVFSFIFSLIMLLSYSIYFHQSNFSAIVELTVENSLTSSLSSSDSETNEDDQFNTKTETSSIFSIDKQMDIIAFARQLFQPPFTVWQPPKIS